MGQNQVKLFFTYFLTYIFGNVNSNWARKFKLSHAGKKICETKQIKFTKLKKKILNENGKYAKKTSLN